MKEVDKQVILACDTSSRFLCLGLRAAGRWYTIDLECERLHSRLLMPLVERMLAAAQVSVQHIDVFACGIGPGSFTGIRVGLSAFKGLAFACAKPLIGISSLDIIARNAGVLRASVPEAAAYGEVVAASDAKRGLVYWCHYRIVAAGFRRSCAYRLDPVGVFVRDVPRRSIIVGDALGILAPSLRESGGDFFCASKDYWYPHAHLMPPLIQEQQRRKGLITDPAQVMPLYLYPQECQVKRFAVSLCHKGY